MSEAKFFMRLSYPSKKAAEEAVPKIREFLDRLNEFYTAWQRIRYRTIAEITPEKGVAELKTAFPDVFEKMAFDQIKPDMGLSWFSGEIAAGTEFTVKADDKQVLYEGEEVWHCSTWFRQAKAMKKFFGAERAEWKMEDRDWWEADEGVMFKGPDGEELGPYFPLRGCSGKPD